MAEPAAARADGQDTARVPPPSPVPPAADSPARHTRSKEATAANTPAEEERRLLPTPADCACDPAAAAASPSYHRLPRRSPLPHTTRLLVEQRPTHV